jgi:hypothetical protein
MIRHRLLEAGIRKIKGIAASGLLPVFARGRDDLLPEGPH